MKSLSLLSIGPDFHVDYTVGQVSGCETALRRQFYLTCAALQSQKAVTAHLKSKQLLPFVFA